MARADNSGRDVILGCRPGVGKRTVGTIELILDIFTIRTNPGSVEASNAQRPAIRKSDGFGSVVDQEGHMDFNMDRVFVPSLIGHNDFSACTIELDARLFRLTHLRRLR